MRRPILALVALAALTTSSVGMLCAPAGADDSAPARSWRRPVVAAPCAQVVDDGLQPLPVFASDGRHFVLGAMGERYRIRLVNPTASRVEAVLSIDGLDAVDGHPANLGKRGYVLPPFADVTIDGWRTSMDTVAAFRFGSVRDSYAARTSGDRNVGLIGVAFFRERAPVAVRAQAPQAARSAAAPPGASRKDADMDGASGLGTSFGETHESSITETRFVRADANPMSMAELRYDDRDGLLSRGIALPSPFDGRRVENERRDSAQAFTDRRFAQPPR